MSVVMFVAMMMACETDGGDGRSDSDTESGVLYRPIETLEWFEVRWRCDDVYILLENEPLLIIVEECSGTSCKPLLYSTRWDEVDGVEGYLISRSEGCGDEIRVRGLL